MSPAKRKIESRETNPQPLHANKKWIEELQKAAFQFSTLRGADALLIEMGNEGFLLPKTSTDLVAHRYRGLNPAGRPDPNQELRRILCQVEKVAILKKLAEVRARIRFLETESKKNAENSSHQDGDLTSSTPTVVGDATADQCG